ncbi:hypothetical protein [Cupriavidus sp. CuC1]|uniref:hypothetical protein n=1 Tax=Cupriavidus sp. CuC1 TaxID=3373131 RepID=UPI0037D05818
MRLTWFIPITFAAIISGCASTESVKESKEESVHKVYQAPYVSVYDATLAATKAKKLELVESDKSARSSAKQRPKSSYPATLHLPTLLLFFIFQCGLSPLIRKTIS